MRLSPGVGAEGGARGLLAGELATVASVDVPHDGLRLESRLLSKSLLVPVFRSDVSTMLELVHGLDGWLPLHAAAALALPPEAVAVILEANRAAVTVLDADGKRPLEVREIAPVVRRDVTR